MYLGDTLKVSDCCNDFYLGFDALKKKYFYRRRIRRRGASWVNSLRSSKWASMAPGWAWVSLHCSRVSLQGSSVNLHCFSFALHGTRMSRYCSLVSLHGSGARQVSPHGSRMSFHGSRTTIHGFRMSLHGSKAWAESSKLYGVPPLLKGEPPRIQDEPSWRWASSISG